MSEAKKATQLLQDPMIASVVAAGLTAVTGTPVQPEQIMQGAKLAEKGLDMKEQYDKQQQEPGRGPGMKP